VGEEDWSAFHNPRSAGWPAHVLAYWPAHMLA